MHKIDHKGPNKALTHFLVNFDICDLEKISQGHPYQNLSLGTLALRLDANLHNSCIYIYMCIYLDMVWKRSVKVTDERMDRRPDNQSPLA